MTVLLRFPVAFLAATLFGGVASAQVPTAPPPHPSLAEVVKEYRRLELPLPPPDAPLVRIKRWVNVSETDEPDVQLRYWVGFRLKPTGPGKDPRYLIGDGRLWGNDWFDPAIVEVAEPTPEALRLVSMGGEELLCFAAQCEVRGWHDLARAAYTRARERYAFIAAINKEEPASVIHELRDMSWWLWERRLTQPGTDRKEVLEHLQRKIAEEPSFRTPRTEHKLRCLALTVAPRKSKPGTVEALIDDLTEYWVGEDEPSNTTGQEPYWKLVELGFDGVPALIEHLSDDRISRTYSEGFNNFWPYKLTVGHLCSRLLYDLSARTIGGGYWALRGDRLDPKKAQEWFTEAQKIGEEKWLLDHAIPEGDPGGIINESGRPEGLIVRVIGAKYPARLPAIYRAMLRKNASHWNNDYVKEILASKLPREQKVALFEEGAGHEDIGHRINALEGLAGVDRVILRKHLLKILKEMADPEKAKAWEPSQLVPFVAKADDRECWDALAAVTKLAPAEERLEVIMGFDPRQAPDEDDPIRRERLRFLVQFLDDPSTTPDNVEDWKGVEVRDYAATQLAGLLRFPVERLDAAWYVVQYNPDRGPVSRFALRELVRQAAARELARAER